ncbi:MAG: glycosyltransferase family 4 protein [Rubrobacter sp.]|jgi:glycosyltransferase involved in cell wall biosynthesis|nr:glycosyltransferase family 4 protein [Rubrobacter sp.]
MRYVAWISERASRLGYEVWLATSDSFFDHPFYKGIQAACGGGLRGIALPGQGSRPFKGVLGYKFRYHRMFAGLYRRLEKQGTPPDYVMVPYLDYVAHAAGAVGSPFGGTPWSGIFINPDFHLRKMGVEAPYGLSSRIKEKLFFKLLSVETLKAVFAFDELLLRYAHEKSPARSKKVRFLPEPVDLGGGTPREEARRKLSINPAETVILVYGVIDESKGLDSLLRSVRHEDFPEDTTLLVAGPQDDETKTLLASPIADRLRDSGRLRERDEFFHGSEEHSLFLASDIVWVGYRKQYISSGVLLQAGMASLPVIACDEGIIGWLSKNYQIGPTVNPEDPAEVAAAVSKLARNKSLATKLGANGREYSRGHTAERFSKTLGDELPKSFPLP